MTERDKRSDQAPDESSAVAEGSSRHIPRGTDEHARDGTGDDGDTRPSHGGKSTRERESAGPTEDE